MDQESYKQAEWPLVGNEHIVNYLSGISKKDDLGGSYIFLGPRNLGKSTLANYFVKSILCEKRGKGEDGAPCQECPSCRQMKKLRTSTDYKQEREEGFEVVHGDFHIVKKENTKKNISVEQIRVLIDALSKSSFSNSYKVGIIKKAETLSPEASNALLKTLEEPRRKVIVIMIASNLEFIPETIVSRSRVLNFYPVKTDYIYDHLVNCFNTSRTNAANISRLSLGRPALAVKLLEDEDFYNKYITRAKTFIDFFGQDINTKFSSLGNIKTATGSSAGGDVPKESRDTLEAWRGVVRDLLLLVTNNKDLIQYKILSPDLERVAAGVDIGFLLAINKKLDHGEKQIESNVNPNLVLEDIACAIN
jgi:DNA polymerase-3 subunit delta'